MYRNAPLIAYALLGLIALSPSTAWAQETSADSDAASNNSEATPPPTGIPVTSPETQASPTTEGAPPVESSVYDTLLHAWELELFQAGETPIRLSQIVIALLVVLIGMWLAKAVSNGVRSRITKLPRVEVYAADLISRLLFYILAVAIFMLGLSLAGIPMTVFAVVGGAIAIGVGFGVQNLCNNLISSVIIMLERPIRRGDIVEVSGEEGRVEEIGNRCTRVRRFDGIDVLVPNSFFLENPVVNWTLHDASIRGKVRVGVAYGSPTDQVEQIIRQATEEQEHVLKTPTPEVIFEDFGDNALVFDVWFWTSITKPMDMMRVQSAIRYAIDAACRDADISIAFPQRDVHLDTLSPLQVEVSQKSSES